jgi:hypothetical protein
MATPKHTPVFIVFLATITLFGCNIQYSTKHCNDKTIKKEERTLGVFTGLELGIAADVQLVQGTPQRVEIEGCTCDLEKIVTRIEGSALSIETEHDFFSGHSGKVTVYITMENMNKLSISGSGSIKSQTPISCTDLSLDIAGSGSINIHDLKVADLHSSIAGSGDISLSGSGKVEKHKIDIAGSGDVKANKLLTAIAEVDIAGSGSCYINVSDKLEASIAGSGDVYYSGKPSVNASVAGSGKVKSLE